MAKSTKVSIEPIETATGTVTIRAIKGSSLICHRFGESAKKKIEDKQSKKGRQAREARDPEKEFRESLYIISENPKKYGFPTAGIKKAIVQAYSFTEGITKTLIKGALHVPGDLLEIKGDGPHQRTDIVRLNSQGRPADFRYRGEFFHWEITVPLVYNARALSAEQIVNLINIAGFHVGIGDWRPGSPSSPGPHGMFTLKGGIEDDEEA